jgi:hypothetical protein
MDQARRRLRQREIRTYTQRAPPQKGSKNSVAQDYSAHPQLCQSDQGFRNGSGFVGP